MMTGTKVFKRLNDQKIYETWTPVLEKYGVNADSVHESHLRHIKNWLCEYAHYHAIFDNTNQPVTIVGNANKSMALNESTTPGLFFQKPGSVAFHGDPVAPTPSQVPFPGGSKGLASDSGSGDKFPSLLPIAIQVAAKTIGFDLVSIIPMDAPVGFLPYLDYLYMGGNLDTEFPPFLIKLTTIKADTESNGSPAETFANVAVGSTFEARNGGGTKQIDLKFVGFTRVDGSVVFRVNSLDAATVEAAFVNGGTLVNTAVSPEVAWDLTADNITVELTSALENQISGFTSTDETMSDDWSGSYMPDSVNGYVDIPDSMTREQSEKALYRQMGLRMFTKFVEAKGDQVAISATIELIQDLNRVWNFDVISMLENISINEVAQSINKRLVSRVLNMGYKHKADVDRVEGADITTLSLEAGGGFENTSTLQRRFVTKILEMANLIYHRSRWGAGEYVVTNGRLATAFADVAGYSFATAPINTPSGAGQLYPAGTVYGLQIYVDPNLKFGDNRVTIGRKGNEEEPGVKFLPYIMAESLQTVSESTFSPKIGLKSRYAITEAGWHPETQYVTLEVDNVAKLLGAAPAVPATP